jgi:predicted Zn-dependent protease
MKQRHSLIKPTLIAVALLAAVAIDTRAQNWGTILDKTSQILTFDTALPLAPASLKDCSLSLKDSLRQLRCNEQYATTDPQPKT